MVIRELSDESLREMAFGIEEERQRRCDRPLKDIAAQGKSARSVDGCSMTGGTYAGPDPQSALGSRGLTLENVEKAFTYRSWAKYQVEAGDQVREALVTAAKAILRNVPECPARTRALNDLIDARLHANSAITWGGLF